MTAISSAATGVWSATGTWTGGVVPVEGDTVSILDSHTVTIDQNITVGADTGTAAITINSTGKLEYLSTAAASYTLTCKGDLVVLGTLEIGTVANPIPSTRTFTLRLNYSATLADGEFGMNVNGGTLRLQGNALGFDRTYLAADASAAATTLTTADSTGWKAGDEIGIASTSRTSTQFEKRILSVDASGTTLTLTVGLTNAHSGTSPTRAEIVNLTRNVKVTAFDTSFTGYIVAQASGTIDADWAEFSFMGENVAGKKGIELNTTTGNVNFTRCAFHDFEDFGITVAAAAANNITLLNCIGYNLNSTLSSGACFNQAGNAIVSVILDGVWFIGGTGAGIATQDMTLQITNCVVTSVGGAGIDLNDTGQVAVNTFDGNVIHSVADYGLFCDNSGEGVTTFPAWTINNLTIWRSGLEGIRLANNFHNLLFDAFVIRGCGTAAIQMTTLLNACIFRNGTLCGDTSFSTPTGFIAENCFGVRFENCKFSEVTGIQAAMTQDISVVAQRFVDIVLDNCLLAASTEVLGMASAIPGSSVRSQRHDQSSGNHLSRYRQGTIEEDTSFYNLASPSEKLTPSSATIKLKASPKRFAINNGETATVKVSVRKSSVAAGGADYNGNPPRLILKRNYAMGLTTDTVLDVMLAGLNIWEQLSGQTPIVTGDGVLEVYVDCDGTAGFINVDDWAVI